MSLTFTQADLDSLKEAYLLGVREVQIGDRKMVYRSQSEILAAIKNIQEYLEGTSSIQVKTIKPTFSKGQL